MTIEAKSADAAETSPENLEDSPDKPQSQEIATPEKAVTEETAGRDGGEANKSDSPEQAAAADGSAKPSGGKGRWYIVQAHSGFEQKVAQQIREKIVQQNMGDKIEEVTVPTEEVIEMRRGKKVATERKFYPGYILVKMVLSDESWHLIKSIPKVSGFLGGSGRPQPIPESEVQRIFAQVEEGVAHPKHMVVFEVGEAVKVTDGPFESFTGVVEDVDEDKERVKVSVSIFGRATPVDLEYTQVEKV